MTLQGDPNAVAGNAPATPGKDETIWNKFGTLGRKKKVEEVKEVVTEGKHAIDSPGMPKSAEMPPEVIYNLKNLFNFSRGILYLSSNEYET